MLHFLKLIQFLKTSDDKIMAVDAKVTIDDNALFRHKAYLDLRDKKEKKVQLKLKLVKWG